MSEAPHEPAPAFVPKAKQWAQRSVKPLLGDEVWDRLADPLRRDPKRTQRRLRRQAAAVEARQSP